MLLFGGYSAAGQQLNSAYSYDPRTDTYTPIAPMPVANRGHCATTLGDDKVLLIGGVPVEPHACIYDPALVPLAIFLLAVTTPFESVLAFLLFDVELI